MRQANNIQTTPVWSEVKKWSANEEDTLISSFAEEMPREALAACVEIALKDHAEGRTISHSDLMEQIKEKRGWK